VYYVRIEDVSPHNQRTECCVGFFNRVITGCCETEEDAQSLFGAGNYYAVAPKPHESVAMAAQRMRLVY
jgi:hypothetical protein